MKFSIHVIKYVEIFRYNTNIRHNIICVTDIFSRFRRIQRISKWMRLKIHNQSRDVFVLQNMLIFYQILEYPTSTIRRQTSRTLLVMTTLKYTCRILFIYLFLR